MAHVECPAPGSLETSILFRTPTGLMSVVSRLYREHIPFLEGSHLVSPTLRLLTEQLEKCLDNVRKTDLLIWGHQLEA